MGNWKDFLKALRKKERVCKVGHFCNRTYVCTFKSLCSNHVHFYIAKGVQSKLQELNEQKQDKEDEMKV